MELEWKWNGTFIKKFGDEKWNGNREEMERKWNGKIMKELVDQKWSGNRGEMERKWNGKKKESNDISKWIWKWNGMETEWKWNFGIILVESLQWNFAKFLSIPLGSVPSNSIPFHGIPLSILKCRPLYAAWVEPFCRPLLSCLALHIVRDKPSAQVPLTPLMVVALRIWHLVLLRNRGLHFDFILGKLPKIARPIFVDASSSWGFGGVHGLEFFSFPHVALQPFIRRCPGWETFPRVPVA